MKKRELHRGYSRVLSGSLALMTGISVMAGNALPAYAEEPEEVSADTQQEAEGEEVTFADGYIAMPDEYEVPGLEGDWEYRDLRDNLVDTETADTPLLMSTSGSASTVHAYPCPYREDWLSYFSERYPVNRHQGAYASCWAHASMALAEFYLIRHGKETKNIDLSELHLSYWCYVNGTASAAAGDTGDSVVFRSNGSATILDNGGSIAIAAQNLMRQRGFAAESVAPYTRAKEIAGGAALAANTERQDTVYLQNAYLININKNPNLVKEAILENGAAGASIYASKSYYNEDTNAYYVCDHTERYDNHAVTIVGWDDDFPRTSFAECKGELPERDGAWLVRNSWSTEIEASYYSYYWISYEDTALSGAWFFEVSKDFPYDNNYYYDSVMHNAGFYRGTPSANVFTVNGPAKASAEQLDAVSFEVAAVGDKPSGYTVEIYRDLTGDTPDSGTLIREATTTGVIAFRGEYTVPLASPVLMEKGEKFAVVVRFDDKDYAIEQERSAPSYGMVTATVSSAPGQSFRSLDDGKTWTDVGTDGNIVIAALTTDADGAAVPSPNPAPGPFDPLKDIPTLEDYTRGVVFSDDPDHILKAEADADGNLKTVTVYLSDGSTVDTQVDHLLRNISFTGADGETLVYTLVFTRGVWDTSYDSGTMGAYTYLEGAYMVAGGVVNQEANGLQYTGDTEGWKFMAAGKVVRDHAGLVLYDDEWFWIDDTGSCDQEYAAIVNWSGADFLVHGGRLRTDFTGFSYDPQNPDIWYHITNGQVWGEGEITDASIEGGTLTRTVINGLVQ